MNFKLYTAAIALAALAVTGAQAQDKPSLAFVVNAASDFWKLAEAGVNAAQEELQMDFESGQAFFEMLVPRAVYYYTGESIADIAQGMLAQGMHMGDDDDEEDEEEEDDEPTPAPKGGRGRGGYSAGGRGGRGGAGNEKECKQQ